MNLSLNSQLIPPYNQNFETNPVGWDPNPLHITKFWRIGLPDAEGHEIPNSGNNAFNIEFPESDVSIAHLNLLVTPSFNLSQMPEELFLSFYQIYYYEYHTNIVIEYSTDDINWQTLYNVNAQKTNWPRPDYVGEDGRTYVYTSQGIDPVTSYSYCAHSLQFLEGNSSVRFRFKFNTPSYYEHLYSLDDYSIDVCKTNIEVLDNPVTINLTNKNQAINFSVPVRIIRYNDNFLLHPIYFYLSEDKVIDSSDIFLRKDEWQMDYSGNIRLLLFNGLYLPQNVQEDSYYILFYIEPNNEFHEIDYSDNTGSVRLNYFECNNIPFNDPITDSSNHFYNPVEYNSGTWKKGIPPTELMSDPPTGEECWYQIISDDFHTYDERTLYSHSLEFSYDTTHIYCTFRFLNRSDDLFFIKNVNNMVTETIKLYKTFSTEWNFGIVDITNLRDQILPRIGFYSPNSQPNFLAKAIDDIYIGPAKPDLIILSNLNNTTSLYSDGDSLYYYLANVGPLKANPSVSKFYFSLDSIWDEEDSLIAEITEPEIPDSITLFRKFAYNKPVVTNTYYIIYFLDFGNEIDEIWEVNNFGVIKINGVPKYNSSYFQDFEGNTDGWSIVNLLDSDGINYSNAYEYSWVYDYPSWGERSIIYDANVSGSYVSYIYSPIFDLSSFIQPVMSFDGYIDSYYEGIEYSSDGGATWHLLVPVDNSFEYIHSTYYNDHFIPSTESILFDINSKFRTYRVSFDLSQLEVSNIQLRFHLEDTYWFPNLFILDNFKMGEGRKKAIIFFLSAFDIPSKYKNFVFESEVRNLGPINIDSLNLCYYLSIDSIIDASDTLVSQTICYNIMPGTKLYHEDSVRFDLIDGFNYCIETIDDFLNLADTTTHRIYPEIISTFPFTESFDSYHTKGWYSYSDDPEFRIRLEPQTPSTDSSYWWITDKLPYYANPTCFLESPVFDFSELDSVYLAFSLRCRGTYSNNVGGNLMYSLNGGNTWSLLGTYYDTLGFDWYTVPGGYSYRPDPLWADGEVYRQRAYNATSLLAGESHVKFRFSNNYNSSSTGRAFILDNFQILETAPKVALNLKCDPKQYINMGIVPWKTSIDIYNLGNISSGYYTIEYYLSADTLLDESDILLGYLGGTTGPIIIPDDTVRMYTEIYSSPPCDEESYLFYKINYQIYNYNQLQIYDTTSAAAYTKILHRNSEIHIFEYDDDSLIRCNSELIKLSVSENENYTYKWSDGSIYSYTHAIDTGKYKVEVTFPYYGCIIGSDSVYLQYHANINQKASIELNLSADSLELMSTTGSSVLWNTGEIDSQIIVLFPGYYYYFYNDTNGCEYKSIPIYCPLPAGMNQLELYYSDSEACEGDSVRITAPLANTYKWSNGSTMQSIFASETDTYWSENTYVNGTFNTDTAFIRIRQYPSPLLTYTHDSMCVGDTLLIQAEFNPDFEYLWSNGSNEHELLATHDGNYWALITNGEKCIINSDTLSIGYYPSPSMPQVIQSGFTLKVDDPFMHIWYYDNEPVDTLMNEEFFPPNNGVYMVESVSDKGCITLSNPIPYTLELGNPNFDVAPNPFTDYTQIILSLNDDSKITVIVYTLDGCIVFSKEFELIKGNHYITLPANAIESTEGVCILTLRQGEKLIGSQKLIRYSPE